jgi:hypothetical protein
MVTPALNEAEQKDPIWWCHHWKINTAYFAVHLSRLFFDEERDDKQIMSILRATLPDFIESLNIKDSVPDMPPKEDWLPIGESNE